MSAPFAAMLLALLAAAAWLDLRRRLIPNWLVAGVVLLWLVAQATGQASAWWQNGVIGLGMLLAGMAVWHMGWLGGGDVKLIAALSLWAGADQLPVLLLAIGVSGGALAVAILLIRRLGQSAGAAMLLARAAGYLPAGVLAGEALSPLAAITLPYGVAVALGGCWLVYRQLV